MLSLKRNFLEDHKLAFELQRRKLNTLSLQLELPDSTVFWAASVGFTCSADWATLEFGGRAKSASSAVEAHFLRSNYGPVLVLLV